MHMHIIRTYLRGLYPSSRHAEPQELLGMPGAARLDLCLGCWPAVPPRFRLRPVRCFLPHDLTRAGELTQPASRRPGSAGPVPQARFTQAPIRDTRVRRRFPQYTPF
jgi:hypothetical protein